MPEMSAQKITVTYLAIACLLQLSRVGAAETANPLSRGERLLHAIKSHSTQLDFCVRLRRWRQVGFTFGSVQAGLGGKEAHLLAHP